MLPRRNGACNGDLISDAWPVESGFGSVSRDPMLSTDGQESEQPAAIA